MSAGASGPSGLGAPPTDHPDGRPAPQAGAAARPAPGALLADLRRLAITTLDANWEHDHTVPSRTLYPHQWSWDSAFIAVGLAHVRPDRAWRELRTLFGAQWADGRVPHIVFNPALRVGSYFPGPEFWGSAAADGAPAAATSGIVQPPVHAQAAWLVHRRAPSEASTQTLRWLYPRLVAQQRYLTGRRDVGGAGLAAIVHPWESGLDNSPAWDAPMAAVPADAAVMRAYRRHDTAHADAAHRPTNLDYARYVAIVASYRARRYSDHALAGWHPFLVECPLFNAALGAAEHALAGIAAVVGADPGPHRDRATAITEALVRRLYDPVTGTFHPRDLRTDRLVPARTVLGLMPLILPDLPARQVGAVLAEACSARFGLARHMPRPLPTHDRGAPDFEPLRYWRGPSWMNTNWLLWRGLRAHHRPDLAAGLRESMLEMVATGGCHEYFHPDTAAGLGSAAFSWTASLLLDVLAEG
ncbi:MULTISPECIES: MGH1-like glycoside hydrolase domain-containing protein [unclassified Micromonospora]|uniref:MGH1-like glycoside hydrolase domain-containing protein n=1 Tax=unclassified Micromonospora TaxID=2617518 RepID=UPI002FF1888E